MPAPHRAYPHREPRTSMSTEIRELEPTSPHPFPPTILRRAEHTVEIVSDSGEGAQKCGQIFGAVSAKMGNGVWTVEIIPAEIQPPPRMPDGASGYRIRIGSGPVTNWGDETNLVVAFNEQVLLARHRLGALAPDATILLENKWESHPDEDVQQAWRAAHEELSTRSYRIVHVPMDEQCLTLVDNPRKGKNMFVLGMLAWIYERDMDRIRDQIAYAFRKKSEEIYAQNVALLQLGYDWACEHIDFRVEVPTTPVTQPMVVMNGNEAIGMGVLAAGFELCAMYPITPATSASHYLGETFDRFGGVLHQAEDEIAAAGVAIGAHHHQRARPRAQDRVHRPGRDDRDATRHRRRAAGRSEHRPSDQGGAVGLARGAVRAAGRRPKSRDGAGDDRGLLPFDDHRAPHRRGVPMRRRRAVGCESGHGRTAVPAPGPRGSLDADVPRSGCGAARHEGVRLG
jgi:Pyruvate/2-oxoacid:ferredoxin oxidoreductase gamma subunit